MLMLRNSSLRLLVLAIATALAIVYAAFHTPAAHAAARPHVDSAERREVALINRYRRAHGKRALHINMNLTRAATWMSRDMAHGHYFAHTDRQGRSPFVRMAVFGYPGNSWRGENLVAGYGSAGAAFRAWRGSPEHNRNMLDGNYRSIGVARVYSASSPWGWYWTTDFGSR